MLGRGGLWTRTPARAIDFCVRGTSNVSIVSGLMSLVWIIGGTRVFWRVEAKSPECECRVEN